MTAARSIVGLQDLLPRGLKHSLMVFRRVPRWRESGVIFIHIPRAGGTSVSRAIYGRPLGHLRAADIRRAVPHLFERLPVVAVARNPWDRLASAYKFVVQGGTAEAGVRRRQIYGSRAFRSFSSFVEEWLSAQDLERLDYVFQPQSAYVTDAQGRVIVDFVGRLEAMPAVEAFLAACLGRRVAIDLRNASSRPRDYREFYRDAGLINRVGDLYRADVDRFGYDY
jgi:hypothetical protein